MYLTFGANSLANRRFFDFYTHSGFPRYKIFIFAA